ncbi:transcriptional regulation of mitochondrial recombination-domain-containing protein [Coniochaeta sp. 2T2.1]|nr:transcriptional regulation of mitochondrial recombination-domain-containing protein [Coniochaeta sp. 2T2.1]
MNTTTSFSVARLVAGLPRVSIREAHTRARMGYKKPDPTPKPTPKGRKGPKPDVSYAEKIWLFTHTHNNHVVYSHTTTLKANKALRQIPFNGKKLRPASIRKDYWRPMAMIEFPQGQGEVGRSVLQKLREFRKRHELEWGDQETIEKMRKLIKPGRGGGHELGKALNDQKANSVADIAAVLGGSGKGNRIWAKPAQDEDPGELHEATIYWAEEVDQAYAQAWPQNVKHVLGLRHLLKAEAEAQQESAEQQPPAPQAPEGGEGSEGVTQWLKSKLRPSAQTSVA